MPIKTNCDCESRAMAKREDRTLYPAAAAEDDAADVPGSKWSISSRTTRLCEEREGQLYIYLQFFLRTNLFAVEELFIASLKVSYDHCAFALPLEVVTGADNSSSSAKRLHISSDFGIEAQFKKVIFDGDCDCLFSNSRSMLFRRAVLPVPGDPEIYMALEVLIASFAGSSAVWASKLSMYSVGK